MKKVYVIHDIKADVHFDPVYFISNGQAIRAFGDACNDSKSQIGAHPEDYRILEVGAYDPVTGKFVLYENPVSLGVGTEFVKINPVKTGL